MSAVSVRPCRTPPLAKPAAEDAEYIIALIRAAHWFFFRHEHLLTARLAAVPYSWKGWRPARVVLGAPTRGDAESDDDDQSDQQPAQGRYYAAVVVDEDEADDPNDQDAFMKAKRQARRAREKERLEKLTAAHGRSSRDDRGNLVVTRSATTAALGGISRKIEPASPHSVTCVDHPDGTWEAKVKANRGTIVRRGIELDSEFVGELVRHTVVCCAEKKLSSDGRARVRVVSPKSKAGWVSEKTLGVVGVQF